MAVYQGKRVEGRVEVRKDAQPFLPADSLEVWSHSPDGFEWGYAGSGPAQLALALLLDVLKDEELAVKLHQRFKFEVVARLGKEAWALTTEGIKRWTAEKIIEGVGLRAE